MRTTDQTIDASPTSPSVFARVTRRLGLRSLAGFVLRLGVGRRRVNPIDRLSDEQLRDIGIEDGRLMPGDPMYRATRQDARIREAHAMAHLLALGMNGR